jgi:hypothetical protein
MFARAPETATGLQSHQADRKLALSIIQRLLLLLQVVLHANGKRQPGRLTADVRLSNGQNAYLVNAGATACTAYISLPHGMCATVSRINSQCG